MSTTLLVIEGINPFPWKSPTNSTMRKGGKVIPTSFPNPELVIYQEAIKEYVRDEYPDLQQIEPGPHGLRVTFWFWRSLNYGGQRRMVADATNFQKALEDALQGLLYDNDRHNRSVTGNVVAQERDIEPLIMISAEQLTDDPFVETRRFAQAALNARGDHVHVYDRVLLTGENACTICDEIER